MKIAKLHPELRTAFRFIPTLPIDNPYFRRVGNWIMSRARPPDAIEGVTLTDQPLEHAFIRIYRPPGPPSGAGFLWVHGGGMTVGAVGMDDEFCANHARDLNLLVVSVNYRLAPDHPYPAAIDDCLEAWRWFVENADGLGVDPRRIALGGQSAGGGLSACLAQRLHDRGGIQPAGVALLCPMLDDRPAARRDLDALAHRIWNNRINRACWTAYLSQPPGAAETPPYAVAARREDLGGLPPTWIAVSDIDLLFDEAQEYHRRLCAHGTVAERYLIPQAPHGFEALLPRSRLARDLFRANQQFLCRQLGLPVDAGAATNLALEAQKVLATPTRLA
jgi:acetyl esterase/lipase